MPQLSASGEVLKALAQFAPVIAMQSKFANQLLEPRSMLRLAFDSIASPSGVVGAFNNASYANPIETAAFNL